MKRTVLTLFALLPTPALAQQAPAARALVERALAAQGGAEALRAIHDVRLHAIVHRNALEQSLRPDGPWFENFADTIETRRLDAMALRTEARNRGFLAGWWGAKPDWVPSATLVTQDAAFAVRDGALRPASQSEVGTAEQSLALGPERVLLTALAAPDLHATGAAPFHGARVETLGFRWQGAPVTLYLQPGSAMPLAVEVVRPHPLDIMLDPWGDVTTRVEWGAWTVEAGGVRYPRQWTTLVNGQPERSVMIDQVELAPAIDPADFAALPELVETAKASRRPVAALTFSDQRAITIAPGLTTFPGPWYVGEVDVPGGTWVIEGPISNTYSKGVIAHVRARGRTLLGVVTTSDSWPHIGGLREYVAARAPIVALDLNRPVIERLLASPHVQVPDRLAATATRPQLRMVAAPMTLGTGPNAMRLYPYRTVTGERQMAIYWPAHRLLYTSDILTPQGDTIWMPQYRDEVASLIAREKLNVETVFGMHYAPMPWADMLKLKGVQP